MSGESAIGATRGNNAKSQYAFSCVCLRHTRTHAFPQEGKTEERQSQATTLSESLKQWRMYFADFFSFLHFCPTFRTAYEQQAYCREGNLSPFIFLSLCFTLHFVSWISLKLSLPCLFVYHQLHHYLYFFLLVSSPSNLLLRHI